MAGMGRVPKKTSGKSSITLGPSSDDGDTPVEQLAMTPTAVGYGYKMGRRIRNNMASGNSSSTHIRGALGSSASAGETTVPKAKNRFAGTTSADISAPKAPEKGKMGTEYVAPKKSAYMAAPKASSPKASAPKAPAYTPKAKQMADSYKKSRDELGAFYLQANPTGSWFESGKKKK